MALALHRVHLALTQLRCVKQKDHLGEGGSDPYLWVSYFAIGAQQLPGQLGAAGVKTPSYDAFRVEMPNDVADGQVMLTPPFISNAFFDMYLDLAPGAQDALKRVGIIAVLMEENSTPHRAIVPGRIAFSKEIDLQLNELIKKRFLENNIDGDLTEAEKKEIQDAVHKEVFETVFDHLGFNEILLDHDKMIGVSFVQFKNDDIKFQYFDFPEIQDKSAENRFILSGRLSLGPVPVAPVDLCSRPRDAYEAKRRELKGFETRRYFLQQSLANATPQQKASIIREINETNARIELLTAELEMLSADLQRCIDRRDAGGGVVVGGESPVNPES